MLIDLDLRSFLAFLDMAVGKPRGFTPNLFRGSYSHAHWITSGGAAIHIS